MRLEKIKKKKKKKKIEKKIEKKSKVKVKSYFIIILCCYRNIVFMKSLMSLKAKSKGIGLLLRLEIKK